MPLSTPKNPASVALDAHLSDREAQIVDLAAQGLTDSEIALQLRIAVSTVNTYWVRIRGKVGRLSRTELVVRAVRSQAEERLSQIQRDHELLKSLIEIQTQGRKSEEETMLHEAIASSVPEALMAVDELGLVRFSNSRLQKLWGYSREEMLTQTIWNLACHAQCEFVREQHSSVITGRTGRTLIGINNIVLARTKDDVEFRIILFSDVVALPSYTLAVYLVRRYSDTANHRRNGFNMSSR